MERVFCAAALALLLFSDARAASDQEPLTTLMQARLWFGDVPFYQNQCVTVFESGMTQVYMHIQKTPASPIQVNTYDMQLTQEQLAGLKAALRSADPETLPMLGSPQPTASINRIDKFFAVTFSNPRPRKVGYVELLSADNRRANDQKSAEELDKAKQALAPLRTWLTALDLRKAVRRSEAVDTCIGLQ